MKLFLLAKQQWKHGLVIITANFDLSPGTSIHSRDISSEHERGSRLCEPGLLILASIFSSCEVEVNTWLVYAELIVHLFILQLSVTLGIMFAYLLGLFVPWRFLAVIGNVAIP